MRSNRILKVLFGSAVILLSAASFSDAATPTPTLVCCGPVTTYMPPTSPINLWNGEGEAAAIAVDPAGNLYVCDMMGGTLIKILPDGSAAYTITCVNSPTGLALGPARAGKTYLFVCSYNGNSVFRIDPDTGAVDRRLFTAGSAVGQIINPNAVSVDEGGNLYVSSRGNQRVDVFAYESGLDKYRGVTFVDGTEGAGGLQFSLPLGTLPLRDRLYVVDSVNNRVLNYPRTGSDPLVFGVPSLAVSLSGQRPRWIASDVAGGFILSGMSWDWLRFTASWAADGASCGSGWTPRAFAFRRDAGGDGWIYTGVAPDEVRVYPLCSSAPTFTPLPTLTPTATYTPGPGYVVTPKPDLPDLDVTFVERLPRYKRWWGVLGGPNFEQLMQPAEADQGWPNPSDAVTYLAHIVNKGAAGQTVASFDYSWTVDGAVLPGTHASPLPPEGEVVLSFSAGAWSSSPLTVVFDADPADAIEEICEANNQRTARKWDLTVRMQADRGMADAFNRKRNTVGSYSYEDWVQLQYDTMNTYWANSTYGPSQTPAPTWPVAPDGMVMRLRVDKIAIADEAYVTDACSPVDAPYSDEKYYDATWYTTDGMDNTNECGYEGTGTQHPCAGATYVGGFYEWVAEVYTHPAAQTTPAAPQPFSPVDWGVPHETSHQLGIPDLYTVEINPYFYVRDLNNVLLNWTDPRIPDVWPRGGIMGGGDVAPHTDGHLWESWNVAGFNTRLIGGRPFRSGYNCEWMWDTPPQVVLKVVDLAGTPVPAVGVTLYQRGVTQYDSIDNTPEHQGVTDADGLLVLVNTPIVPTPFPTTLTGHQLKPSPFGQISIGVNGLMFIRFTKCLKDSYDWLRLPDVNQAYWLNKIDHPGQEDSLPVTFTYRVSLCVNTPTRTPTPTRTSTGTATVSPLITDTPTSTPSRTSTWSPTPGTVCCTHSNEWTGFQFPGGEGEYIGVTYHEGYLFVANFSANQVERIEVATGVRTVHGSGFSPTGLAVGPDAQGVTALFVSDYFGNRIYQVDLSTGAREVTIGAGILSNPEGLAIDATGAVFVAERGFHRVQKFVYDSGPGAYVSAAVNSMGSGGVTLLNPLGVALDQAGHLYVGDLNYNRVVRYDAGALTNPVLFTTASRAKGVAYDPAGGVYVTEASRTVGLWDLGGVLRSSCPASNTNPRGVAVGGGFYFVAEGGSGQWVRQYPLCDLTTPTSTPTSSPTPANTDTPTPSPTQTGTDTPVSTDSPTYTGTFTPTSSATNSYTATLTASRTPTDSATPTPTPSPSHSATATDSTTATPTPSPSASPTDTASPTHTPSWSPTITFTPPPTVMDTFTPSPTGVPATFTPEVGSDELRLFPNPCRGPFVDLSGFLDGSSYITVKAFTVSSRHMASWRFDAVPAGGFQRRVNLVDRAGKPLANGIYYLLVSTPKTHRVLKLIVLR